MNLLKQHYSKIVLQDFLIKYQIQNIKYIPKLEKIILSAKFGGIHTVSVISLFEILTFQKCYITQSRYNILSLNLRKGEPVGIKLVIRKKAIYDFLMFFLFEILPNTENFEGLKIKSNSIDWSIQDIFVLDDTNYLVGFFKEIEGFNFTIKGTNLQKNFFFACRFPIKHDNDKKKANINEDIKSDE